MNIFDINNIPPEINISGSYDNDSCSVELSDQTLQSLKLKKLKLTIYKLPGSQDVIKNIKVIINADRGEIILRVGGSDNTIVFDEGTSGKYDILAWAKSNVHIGSKTTAGDIKIFCDNSEFSCGNDCMFSNDIVIQSTDQHAIIDIAAGSIINSDRRKVILGDHVWLGRRTTLTASASIGSGSLVGVGSIVVSTIPSKVVAAGVPARVIKSNHTWSRSSLSMDAYSEQCITDYSPPPSQVKKTIFQTCSSLLKSFMALWSR